MENKIRILVALLLVGFLVYALVDSTLTSREKVWVKEDGSVLIKIESYEHADSGQSTCNAFTPECGYCPGEVFNDYCYAEKTVADEYNN